MKEFKPAPIKPSIDIEMLENIDIRVGTIVSVDDIPESDKLVRLNVDFGDMMRTILVGMKGERDDPSSVCGMQALFVVNIKPRKMFGYISEGMLFDIGYQDKLVPVMAQPEHPVPNGARAG